MTANEISEHDNPTYEIVLTLEAQHFLRGAGKWAGFLGIMGFIGSAFTLVAALFVGNIAEIIAKFKHASPTYPNAMGGIVSLIYVVVAILYFFLSLNLFQFGSKIKTGLHLGNSAQLSAGLRKLKSFFLLWGIATIALIIIIVLLIIAGVAISIGWQM